MRNYPKKNYHNILWWCGCLCLFMLAFPIKAQKTTETKDISVPDEIKIGKYVFLIPSYTQKAIQTHTKVLQDNTELLKIRIKNAQEYLPLVENILVKNDLPKDFKYLALLNNGENNFWNFAKNRDWNLKNDNLVNENDNIVCLTDRFVEFCKKVAPTKGLEWVALIAFTSPKEDWQGYLKENFKDLLASAKPENVVISLPTQIPDELAKFLAHKLVFESKLSADNSIQTEWVIEKTIGKNLSDIAKNYGVDYGRLRIANNWLKTDKIPNDKFYSVIIPVFVPSPTENVDVEKIRGFDGNDNVVYNYPDDYDTHIVKQGEGIYKIARQYNISPQDFMKWNNLTLESPIKAGQELRVSPKNKTNTHKKDKFITQKRIIKHIVDSKETFYGLSKTYNVSIEQIKTWNPETRTNGLLPNQTLQIYQEVKVASPNVQKMPTIGRYRGIGSVPTKMFLLNKKLTISKDAVPIIQKMLDVLMKNPTKYLELYDRKKEYEGFILGVLEDENMPSDFLYLPIMESKLEGIAVSTSNAVGYWQMKSPVANEMKLIMDNEVDERMDIIASTRAGSKYLKRNYKGYGDDWLKATLGYQMGFGGARRFFEKNEFLKNGLVTAKTPAYILKFIAHKLAFSEKLPENEQATRLITINVPPNTELSTIAEEQEVNLSEIYTYNPWLKTKRTPKNRNVTMIIPK